MIDIIYRLTRALAMISAVVGILMAAIVAVGIGMRYLLGEPLAVQEEIVGLLFCSMVFLALPQCTLAGTHICLTVVRDALGKKGKAIADLGATLGIIVFSIVFSLISYDFAYMSNKLEARSVVGNFLLYPWMALIPIMSFFTALLSILRYLRNVR